MYTNFMRVMLGKVEQQETDKQVIIFKDYSCGKYSKNMRNIEWSESQNKIVVKHENDTKTEEEKT